MEENKIRINKFLASKGLASRRQVDLWIEEGKILVNGSLATSGQKVSEEDEIIVNGKSFSGKKETKVYYLLYKEEEVLSAVKDDRGRRTVIDCIPTPYRIFPVGRLDYRTSGLILLTNDGELFNRIMHPRAEIFKSYEVLAKGHLTKQQLKTLEEGVELEEGKTLAALVAKVKYEKGNTFFEISIREGRNRQIRRMVEAVGSRVYQLRRTKIGKLSLDGLSLGKYRMLKQEEIEYLYSL
ncbi:MAG TPA: pseudouridine synthase [Fusobacterium sp.]|uniref:pseudouridine synthase n=1 Tax=Fusobacterium sp. TaxID=68766 RepID=UPI002F3F8580